MKSAEETGPHSWRNRYWIEAARDSLFRYVSKQYHSSCHVHSNKQWLSISPSRRQIERLSKLSPILELQAAPYILSQTCQNCGSCCFLWKRLMSSLPASLKNSRCILHVDLDCFYCQVEQVRLGIPFDVPAAVQQWHGLIAVNYAARKAGIKKMTTVTEAKRLCPEIHLLHVATYAENDTEPQYYENPDRNTHKVSLDAYRNASRQIFKIFNKYCDKIQKIGTDEGFMDVTKIVNQRLIERYIDRMPQLLDRLDQEECGVDVDWEKLGYTVTSLEEERMRHQAAAATDAGGEGQEGGLVENLSQQTYWSPTTWKDLQLALGAELAAEIRKEVFDTLHYFCSAGIAHYKVVAKLCSSRNKPNKQTILRETARMDFMRDIPFNKIRNLGGKLGNEVGSDLEIDNASELWSYSVEELQRRFGESTGLYLYDICRGIDHEEVNASKPPQSLMAAKSFTRPIYGRAEMQRWFSILAAELQRRIMDHFEEFGIWPRNITIKYATVSNRTYRSKSLGPMHRNELKTPAILAKKFENMFNSFEDAYPCIGLDLCASGLVPDESAKSYTINKFFSRSTEPVANQSEARSLSPAAPISEQKSSTTTNSKPKKGLDLFFVRKAQPDPESTDTSQLKDDEAETSFVCDKCSKKIPIASIQEHTDYHFAFELMEQEKQQQLSTSTTTTNNDRSSNDRKRSNSTDDDKEEKKRKRALFFQPRTPSS